MHEAPEYESQLWPPADLASRISPLPTPLVFTNGVFDILHRGHVTYLAQARALGASLVVALNSDQSARRLVTGSIRTARHAGTSDATPAAATSEAAATSSTVASVAATP